MTHFDALLLPVKNIAITAGIATLPFFQNEGTAVHRKVDGSPVTMADQASEDIILDALKALTPNIPVIAEEQAEAGQAPDIRGHDTFWLVDPLDGTKEFIKGSPDYTVNIGLIHQGTPVLGAVYIPITKELYYGGQNIGAYFNGQAIHANKAPVLDKLKIILNKQSPITGKSRTYLAAHGIDIGAYVMRGSSLKFCLVADGQADFYPRFVPTYEWDTAAAHAILLQAGGDIIDFDSQKRLTYGKSDKKYLNGSLITGCVPLLKHMNYIQ